MRTVILGAAGMLGQEFVRRVPDALALNRLHCDVTDAAALSSQLEAARPDVVLNCSAYNRVDAAEADPTPAFAINALAVRTMAAVCRDLGCLLVHFSTNYAFGRDLKRRAPYREEDLPAPPNAYGVSKVSGEQFVRDICPRHLVIRTAALFGPGSELRNNFLESMLARARSDAPLRIVSDQTIAPTSTADLAAATLHLVSVGATGLFHVNGPEGVTWFELARHFLNRAALAQRPQPVSTEELAAPAPRPRYSVLAIDRYHATGGPAPRPWRQAVDDYWESRLSLRERA